MNRHHNHPDWCAQGHRCGLGEHRATPITIPGAGAIVITRVRATNGRDHAEIHLRTALSDQEPTARQQLTALLTHLRTLLGPPRTNHRPHQTAT